MGNSDVINKFSKMIFSDEEIDESIFKNDSGQNVKAHRNNYLYGLISVLENYYISIKIFLEEENFHFFCKKYIESTPSTSPNVDDYGEKFPEFLGNCQELEDVAYIKHLAALDWFWVSSGQEGAVIELPKGVLDLWGKITNSQELIDIEIDENMIEKIEVFLDEENNYYMKIISTKEI